MRETLQRYLRLNIAKKLLLGFLSYGALTVLIALFALSSLEELTVISQGITQRDIPLLEITDRMTENLFSQEVYAGRWAILKSPEVLALFWERSEEFKELIGQLGRLPRPGDLPIEALSALHEEYAGFFHQGSGSGGNPGPRDPRARGKHEEILRLVKKVALEVKQEQAKKNRMISRIGSRALRVITGLCLAGILLGLLVALIMTRNISGPIRQLKASTKEISEGNFDRLPTVRGGDELGDLSRAFKEMAIRLKQLEEMYLDANPLTRLPGGVAIEQVLKTKLAEGAPLAFCLLDLRHFKAFNDRYGYARGNEVILATADVIRRAAQSHGRQEDFVGHIGGDDFVLITGPGQYEKICAAIIEDFDRKIQDFYDPEDRRRGHLRGKTRTGEVVSFPIMTLSIAVVTNRHRSLKSHIQVGEIAAEMKNFAKTFSRSICVVDRRRDPEPGSPPEEPRGRREQR